MEGIGGGAPEELLLSSVVMMAPVIPVIQPRISRKVVGIRRAMRPLTMMILAKLLSTNACGRLVNESASTKKPPKAAIPVPVATTSLIGTALRT